MHVVGEEFFVKLDYDISYYQVPGRGESEVNKHIYAKLSTNSGFNWSRYDKWEYHTNGQITYNQDGVIDMIYKVHRYKYSEIFSEGPASGFAYLGVADNQMHYLVDAGNQKYVYGGFPDFHPNEIKGSGVSLLGNGTSGILTKAGLLGRLWHEHGHYFFGAHHIKVGLMGDVWDPFMNPLEQMYINYVSPYYSNVPYEEIVISDISGRFAGNPSCVRVQLPSSEILISHRNKVSHWDRQMLGDTAYGDLFRATNYGNGIYFYHITGIGLPGYTSQDLECADGLWKWVQYGYETPDWDENNPWLPLLKRTIPIRGINDDGLPVNINSNPNTVKDGLTIRGTANNPPYYSSETKWFSVGKKKNQNENGIDRIFTNEEENWTSREFQVDRWDAWNKDYNEIFSPYSSPGTTTWDGQNSGVFIWINNVNGNQATIRIYRDIEYNPSNGLQESEILIATPPSKPMGLKIDRTECIDYRVYPIISWTHNIEPDMLQGQPQPVYKRYKIFRAWDDANNVPGEYSEIADIFVHKDNEPTYIDYTTYGQCDQGTGEINYRIRYKIKAVDNTTMLSVYSDYISISSYFLNRGGGEGGDAIHSEEIFTYELKQNYPNPFNPVTNIQYQIVNQGMVSLKVYDMLGREVKTIINEIKSPGKYVVSFDASGLSSGVYFYKMTTGEFTNVKRMILIK